MVDTWRGDILSHRLWCVDLGRPGQFVPMGMGGPMACVHEMVAQGHERNAFVRHVLSPGEGPNHEGYLDDVCSGDPAVRHRVLGGVR